MRRVKALGWLSVLVALAVTLSCVPPYFPELDAAAGLIRHMSSAGTVGPLQPQLGSANAVTRFLPSRPTATSIDKVDITSGFLIASSPLEDYVTFLYVDPNGGTNYSELPAGANPFSTAGANPNFPLYQYEVVATPTAPPSLVVFKFDPVIPGNSQYGEFQGDPTTGAVNAPFGFTLSLSSAIIPAPYLPVGASIDPTAPAPQSNFTFLLQNGALMNTGSATVDNSGGIFAAGSAGPTASIPGATNRALIFNNVKKGSMVGQYRSASTWVTVQWVGATPTPLKAVTKRLDAVLSDGDLVSTEGGNLTLYDSAGQGTVVFSVPLHGLQFCYEAFVGSTPYVFFTLPLSGKQGNLVFSVFAIPTSEMRNLGK